MPNLGVLLARASPHLRAGLRGLGTAAPGVAAAVVRRLVDAGTSGFEAAFRRAAQSPRAMLDATLARTLRAAEGTAFARDHRLTASDDLATYRERVPVRDFDGCRDYFDRVVAGEPDVLRRGHPLSFGKSSGSTGASKVLPLFDERDSDGAPYPNLGAIKATVFRTQVLRFPDAMLGYQLNVFSLDPVTRAPGGVAIGHAGGGSRSPMFEDLVEDLRPYRIEDADLRYYLLLRLAAQADLRVLSVLNPATAIVFAKKAEQFHGRLAADLDSGGCDVLSDLPNDVRLWASGLLRRDREAARRLRGWPAAPGDSLAKRLWPRLVLLHCWLGGAAGFYRGQIEERYPGVTCWDPGYGAVEGAFASAVAPETADGVVNVFTSLLEFIPEQESRETGRPLLADELATGGRYRLIVTDPSRGLYRYDTHDIVECGGSFENLAQIRFLYRDQNTISFTGEKVTEHHAILAMERVQQRAAVRFEYAALTARFDDPPYYVLAVEAVDLSEAELRSVESSIDACLAEVNTEYDRKRRTCRLAAARVLRLPSGFRQRYYEQRLREGAQDSRVKVPHLFRDADALFRLAESS